MLWLGPLLHPGQGHHDALATGQPGNDAVTQVMDLDAHALPLSVGERLRGRGQGEIELRIDGMRVNDPGTGAPLVRPVAEFVDGVEIGTGTQGADRGGYSGGSVDFRTARSSNTMRGEFRQSFMPRFARPRLTLQGDDTVGLHAVPRFGWQSVLRVGGPIMVDRMWWSAGAMIQRSSTLLRQTFRAHPSAVPYAEQTMTSTAFEGQGFARVDWALTPRHHVWASSFVAPGFVRRPVRRPLGPDGRVADGPSRESVVDPRTGQPLASEGLLTDALGWDRSNVVGATAGYAGRVAQDMLEIDARFGFVQGRTIEAWRLDDPSLAREPTRRWSDAEGRSLVDVLRDDHALDRVPDVVDACAEPDTCAVRRWASGGVGPTQHSRSRRIGGGGSATHYFTWLGAHAMRYAVEAEHTERVRSIRDAEGNDVHRVAAQNYAGSIHDVWQPFYGLALVPGVRWEAQDIRDADGRRVAAIADNVSPRVAASYDWTGEGRSWLHASYGHHVQQLPLALFEGDVRVAPSLKGPFDAQTVVGYAHEVVDDVILAVSLTHRELGRAAVPIAVGHAGYVIANPHSPHLQRNSDAFTFEIEKRFARSWMLTAGHTYAREIGNYEGLADPLTGDIDRSQAQRWASPELQRNTFGPSTTSAPHRFAADVFRFFDFEEAGSLTVGAGARVFSGPPVSVRAPSGRRDDVGHVVHVLPKGSGGRLAPLARLNVHLHYDYPLSRAGLLLGVGLRLFNVTNAQPAIRADERYTQQGTRAIAGGDVTELRHAKVQRRGAPDRYFDRGLVQPAAGFRRVIARPQPVAGQLDSRILF